MEKIIFEDFTGEITKEIENIILNWLEESASELESQTATRTGAGAYHSEIASKWTHLVDKSKYEAIIGNPLENALWVEYGTGEYALNDDGRKDWWVFIEGSGKSNNNSKHYKTKEEAARTVAFLRSKGIPAGYTKGQLPKRPLHLAFTNNEKSIKDELRNRLGSMK